MDILLDYFKIVVLLSIPQSLIHILLTFSIWNLKPSSHIWKLVIFSVINSLIIDLDILHVPTELHLLSSTVLSFSILYIIFRTFGFKKVLIVFLTYVTLIMLTELLSAMLMQLTYGLAPQKEMFEEHFLRLLSVSVPVDLLLIWLSRYIERRNFAFFLRLYQYLINIKQTRMKEVLLLTLFQTFLIGVLFVIGVEDKHYYSERTFNFLIYFLLLASFGAFFYTIRLMLNIREEAVRQTQDVYVEEIGKMFTSIRGQRHDFLNHVQVMYSMLKMNKLEQLKSYMDDLVKEAHAVSTIVSHPTPALAAFIQAKMEMAITRNINFTYQIPDLLDIESSIKSIDLIKIMGNLVDNAFDESDTLPIERRLVHLSICIAEGKLAIEVRNQGRLLTEQDKMMIILPGYTTKQAGHSGLGLAIVHERVQFYKGLLHIHSSAESGTTILVSLPHR
ncbi:sensor histidine kinase [Cohnella mopanensis]|uniref:sensor histidine kinase n=1 Tax=Cohnella mopanensis TaxID=2911966 RepID=UPI001EF8AA88|nr:ATP-binding protein [Cohnella mopanensis]